MDENNEEDIIKEETRLFKLPDETIVTIPKRTRIIASELLFTPSVFEDKKNEQGLISLLTGSIKKTESIDKKFKESLVENVVLSGGTTMMEGFADRVYQDLYNYKDNGFELEYEPVVIAENNRAIGKWIGKNHWAKNSPPIHKRSLIISRPKTSLTPLKSTLDARASIWNPPSSISKSKTSPISSKRMAGER
jgi:actin-related protein